MNLIVTRTKQENTCIWWEPFATSTPLKTGPDKPKFKNELQKELLTKIDTINFGGLSVQSFNPVNNFQRSAELKHLPSKMAKKSKSSGYFDLSSSSSDDDSNKNKKRPIIKLSTKRNNRSLLSNKKPKNEIASKVNLHQKEDDTNKMENISFSKSKENITVDLKPKKSRTNNVRIKTKNTSENPKTGLYATFLKTDECGRNFDELSCIKKSVDKIEPSVKNVQDKNHSKSDEKFGSFSNVIKNETGLKEMRKSLIKSACGYNRSRNQKLLVKTSTENYRVSKPHMKAINIPNDVRQSKKTSTRKVKGKLALQSVNLENQVVLLENKTNLSHQLFSDSKKQEFINTLDLTSEEINDAVGHVKWPLWQKQKKLPFKEFHPSSESKNKSLLKDDEEEQIKPKRRRQRPKEFWLPQNKTDEILINTNKQSTLSKPNRNPKVSKQNDGQALTCKHISVITAKEQDIPAKEYKESNHESNKVMESIFKMAPRGGRKRKNANMPEEKNFHPPEDASIKCTNGKNIKNTEVNCMYSSLGSNADITKKAEPSEVPVKNATMEEADKTVFKQLSELSFNDSEMGCSTVQCWNINTFKCGVFKLKTECQFTCKTLHRNSHLGGVLVKGTLKMKIQDKEHQLKEGDMAFVPPLTEWQATNIGESEAVFYYWCGRFK